MAELLVLAATSAAAASGGAAATTAVAATTSAFSFANVMTGIGALATVASGGAAYMEGKASEEQMELQAKQEEINGRFAAINTNEELIKTMANNKVASVASGLMSAGSVQRAGEMSQKKAAEELNIQRFNTDSTSDAYRAQGKAAKNKGITSLIGSTISAGNQISGALKTKRKTK